VKITHQDYKVLESAIKRTIARTGLSLDNYISLGLSAKRYRWDLLAQSDITIGDGINVIGDLDLYAYANKTHIDTALRKITRTR
jgi:hypothetical protein